MKLKNKIYIVGFFALFACNLAVAQNTKNKKTTTAPAPVPEVVLPETIVFDPYNPEDSLGIYFLKMVIDFEKFGHLAKQENQAISQDLLKKYIALFNANATLPNELGKNKSFEDNTLAQFQNAATGLEYQPYLLFVQKGVLTANLQEGTNEYVGKFDFFKLYADKASFMANYESGVFYTLTYRYKVEGYVVQIDKVEVQENGVKNNFALGGFGYMGTSAVLICNNLNALVKPLVVDLGPQPRKKEKVLNKSNITLQAGVFVPMFLQTELIASNLNFQSSRSDASNGQTAGIQLQKVFGKKGMFGMSLGVAYQQLKFNNTYNDQTFVYTSGPDNSELEDLEGNIYDVRFVQISSFEDNGSLTYIRPEFGLLLNFPLSKSVWLQLNGAFGQQFMQSNTYNTNTIVSYQGQINGQGGPISQDELGFYTNYKKEATGNLSTAQSFTDMRFGASLDVMLGQRVALMFQANYHQSLTYAFREQKFGFPFFDPAVDSDFQSKMNYLDASRNFKAVSFQFGVRFYFKQWQ